MLRLDLPCVAAMQASVRKTHNTGRKHKDAVIAYYKQWLDDATPEELEKSRPLALLKFTRELAVLRSLACLVAQLLFVGRACILSTFSYVP